MMLDTQQSNLTGANSLKQDLFVRGYAGNLYLNSDGKYVSANNLTSNEISAIRDKNPFVYELLNADLELGKVIQNFPEETTRNNNPVANIEITPPPIFKQDVTLKTPSIFQKSLVSKSETLPFRTVKDGFERQALKNIASDILDTGDPNWTITTNDNSDVTFRDPISTSAITFLENGDLVTNILPEIVAEYNSEQNSVGIELVG